MGEPNPDDDAYGAYNLAYAYLGYLREETLGAMENVVESIAFETKDVDTFPDALMLSARCYELQNSWHRARDVYYEVACLFRNTHWHDLAMDRLRFIVSEGLTTAKEQAQVSNVFFGVEEDMDKKVNELLGIKVDEERLRPGKEKESQGKMRKAKALALLAGIVLTACCWTCTARAQAVPAAEGTVETTAQEIGPQTTTFWGLVKQGGWTMFPLGLLSVAGIGLIIYGFVSVQENKMLAPQLVPGLQDDLSNLNIDQARTICNANPASSPTPSTQAWTESATA